MSLAASSMPPSLISRICLMLKGRNNLVLLPLSVFEIQYLPRSTVFHIVVVPEVKPNVTMRHANDLGILRSATTVSIANCSGKLGCKLVEMSLAASSMSPSLISKIYLVLKKGRNNLFVLLFLSVFEIQHVPMSTSGHSRTRGQAKRHHATCVRSRNVWAVQSSVSAHGKVYVCN